MTAALFGINDPSTLGAEAAVSVSESRALRRC